MKLLSDSFGPEDSRTAINSNFHKHQRESISETENNMTDPDIEKNYNQENTINDNDVNKNPVGSVKHSCEHCNYMTTRKSQLLQHVQSQHEGVIYSCDNCYYNAKWKGDLRKHVKSVHDGVKHSCDQCDYKTSWKSDIRKHVQSIHDGIII